MEEKKQSEWKSMRARVSTIEKANLLAKFYVRSATNMVEVLVEDAYNKMNKIIGKK